METSLKSLRYQLKESGLFDGKTRLYVDDLQHDKICGIEKIRYGKKNYREDILYIDDWKNLSSHLSGKLPQNILCFHATNIHFPKELKGHNVLFTTFPLSEKEVQELAETTTYDYAESVFPIRLLSVLHDASIEKICSLTSEVCSNPVFVLDFNFRVAGISLMDTDSPDIINLCSPTAASYEFVDYTHSPEAVEKANKGEILVLPKKQIRFYLVPIMQSNVSVSYIMLVEDRVKISETDLDTIRSAAKGMEILEVGSRVLGDSGKPIYEYALVRALTDEFGTFGSGAAARFTSLGYPIKNYLRVLVLDTAQEVAPYDAKPRTVILARQLRAVIGQYGLCTTVRDYIVIFLNMDNKNRMGRILLDLRLFSSKNSLRVGISPWFTDVDELWTNHQRALDAISIGPVIMPDEVIYFQENLKIYKMVTSAFKNMPLSDLIPSGLDALIKYDHEHNTEFVNTLYCYIQSMGNSKQAAEILNIHRNTFLYRMEKIYEIMEMDTITGNDFIELGIGYYVLEFMAKQNSHKLCFSPAHKKNEPESV